VFAVRDVFQRRLGADGPVGHHQGKDGASLAIIVVVLLLRPNGLFGTPATQRS
jgi:branched-subunit amino acid ABC-type transport system permease component